MRILALLLTVMMLCCVAVADEDNLVFDSSPTVPIFRFRSTQYRIKESATLSDVIFLLRKVDIFINDDETLKEIEANPNFEKVEEKGKL